MIPELVAWTYPAICSLGSLTMRRAPVTTAVAESSEWIETLFGERVLVPLEPVRVDARARNFVLEYVCEQGDAKAAHDELREQFNSAVDFVVGRLPQNLNQSNYRLMLFGRKSDSKRMTIPTLSGNPPSAAYRITACGRGGDGVAKSIERIMSCFVEAAGNIFFQRGEQREYTIQQLETATARMQPADFHTLVASFKLLPKNERSDFQEAFLRVAIHLQSKLPSQVTVKESCQLVDLLDLPDWVMPLQSLRNLSTTLGERLVQSEPVEQVCQYNLREIFANPTLLEKYSVGLHGGPGTTGFGKTTCGIQLLSVYCKSKHAAGELEAHQRRALISNTLESAKTINFIEQGVIAWLVDEFDAHDSDQQQFLSSSMFKVLLTPMLMGTLRCKGSDTIAMPQGLIRVFTSNSNSPQEWTGQRFEYTAPMARKHIFFTVHDRLVSEQVEAAGVGDLDEHEDSAAVVAATALLDAAGI